MKLDTLLNTLSKKNPYKSIESLFNENKRLKIIKGPDYKDFTPKNWPKGSGVYLVRVKESKYFKDTLYIGKTGKLTAPDINILNLNKGCLSKRVYRNTPYCFQNKGKYKNFFEYGPKPGNLSKYSIEERYTYRIPFSEIEIVTFSTDKIEIEISPALIESLLLTMHVQKLKFLPLANQEL